MTKKTFRSFTESIIDPVRPTFSRQLFADADTDHPTLLPQVKKQIEDGIKAFETIAKVRSFQLIGSSLTKQYRDDADLDINVVFDVPEDQRDLKYWELVPVLHMINGQTVRGTRHPINYYIVMNQQELDQAWTRADNIFDIERQLFIKKQSESLGQVDIQNFVNKFADQITAMDLLKSKFQRDLVDYKDFADLSHDDALDLRQALEDKYHSLEDDIDQLIAAEDNIAVKRRAVFARSLSKDELQMYGTYNRMPENILYKILEKYHYLDFISHLRDVRSKGPIDVDSL